MKEKKRKAPTNEKNFGKNGKKIAAVFFGGKSFEREISVLTGIFVLNALKGADYELLPVYLAEDDRMYTSDKLYSVSEFLHPQKPLAEIFFLPACGEYRVLCGKKTKSGGKISCAINCCHGGWGEGGGLAAFLKFCGIPLASPDCPTSALFMDKILSKYLVAGMGVPVLPYVAVLQGDDEGAAEEEVRERLGYPVVIKPARLGSSIGVAVVREEKGFLPALKNAFRFDGKVLIEPYLKEKRDVNCAAYRVKDEIKVSACEEPLSGDEILSFREKYDGDGRAAKFPAEIPAAASEEIRGITRMLYTRLALTGVVRADFLYDGEKVYFNELNTVPGSLAYYLFGEKISEAKEMFLQLLHTAEAGREEKPVPRNFSFLPHISPKGGKCRLS